MSVCGGFALAKGFVELLNRELPAEVVSWNPFEKMRCRVAGNHRAALLKKILRKSGLKAEDATAQARQQANLLTRRTKGMMPAKTELFAQWKAQAKTFEFGQGEVDRLLGRAEPIGMDQTYRSAWQQGATRLACCGRAVAVRGCRCRHSAGAQEPTRSGRAARRR